MSMGFTRGHAQTAGDLGFAMQIMLKLAFFTTPLSSGRIVPRVTIAGVTLFIPCERPNVQHSITGYSRLPQPSPPPALIEETRVCHWQFAQRLSPDMRRLQLPFDDCCNRNLMVG